MIRSTSQSGFITIDFLFALVMAWGFLIVFFSISLTFSFFEVAQYMAYSTSRSFFPAHVTPDAQQALAAAKYQQLVQTPVLRALLGNGFFTVDPFTAQSKTNFNDTYGSAAADTDQTFIGVRLRVLAKVLEKRLPFLGKTYEDEGSFSTFVTSFLGREVTEQECIQNFNAVRYQAIMALGGYDGGGNGNVGKGAATYTLITDNGC